MAGKAVCKCGADLSVLQCLDAVIDGWFNAGLDALARNESGLALEWLAACCKARPSDAAALRALAKVWGRLGHLDDARRCVDLSRQSDPDHPDLDSITAALCEPAAATNPVKNSDGGRKGFPKKRNRLHRRR